jgi:hypothetical protein
MSKNIKQLARNVKVPLGSNVYEVQLESPRSSGLTELVVANARQILTLVTATEDNEWFLTHLSRVDPVDLSPEMEILQVGTLISHFKAMQPCDCEDLRDVLLSIRRKEVSFDVLLLALHHLHGKVQGTRNFEQFFTQHKDKAEPSVADLFVCMVGTYDESILIDAVNAGLKSFASGSNANN